MPNNSLRPSFFQRLRSYFSILILARQESRYSGRIELWYQKGRYMLVTARAVYSYEDLYTNFRRAFEQLEAQRWQLKQALVLGMGLGSVPQLLERNFGQKDCHYTLVEIDPLIIDWATRTTLPKLKSKYQVVAADAILFVANSSDKYDLIVIDIFIDDEVPTNIESRDFLQKIKLLLSPTGRVLCNRLADTEAQKARSQYYFDNVFLQVFPQARIIDVDTNMIFEVVGNGSK
jgi:spermidine synthase